MKKFINYISLMLLAVSSMAFVSCDEDVQRSITLSGQWNGDFGMYYIYTTNRGREIKFDSYDTDIVFYPDYDYATHGWGKQVDWYEEGPYEKMFYHFKWSIKDRILYLEYPHNPELNTAIYDYKMREDYFTGYFENSSTKFRLHKISDYYSWDDYESDWYYGYERDWDDGYFRSSPITRSVEVEDSAEDNGGEVIMRGNRFRTH